MLFPYVCKFGQVRKLFLVCLFIILALNCVSPIFAADMWVATGTGTNTLAYSANGTSWTGLGTSIFSNNAYGVAWNGSVFVAVGNGTANTIAYSSDGVNWTGIGKTIFSSQGFGVAWNGTYFVATGMGTNTLAYSPDGVNWTGLGTSVFATYGFGITWNGSKFVATGTGTNGIAYSPNGVNWTGLGNSIISDGREVAWNGTRFVALGIGTNTIAYSSDGVSWTGLGATTFSIIGYGIAWNGTYFVAAGAGTNTLAYSSNGISWTGLGTSIFTTSGRDIAWNGTKFIAVGEGTNTLAYSSDGINWTGLGTSIISVRGQSIASAPAPAVYPPQSGMISSSDYITITTPSRAVGGASSVATLSITDESNIPFHVPYIQTSSSLTVAATIGPTVLPAGGGAKFVLNEGLASEEILYDLSSPFTVTFTSLEKGTYTLDAYVVNSSLVEQVGTGTHDEATSIGIGDIITAIGDSITMGYAGSSYGTSAINNWLGALSGSYSTDYRNYPQYGPQGGVYYKSFLTELNNKLSAYYGYPVFIMNEGWGGYKTSDYITLMATSQWSSRQTSLQPNKWIVNLGVNDAGASVSPSTYKANLQTIITSLITNYGAEPENIYLSKPNYTTSTPYTTVLPTYLTPINELINSNNLSTGPDFYNYFLNHYATFYIDIVHPNASGFTQIARLNYLSMIRPQNVSVSQTAGNINLTWEDLSIKEATIAGYKVKYGTSSGTYSTTLDVGNVTTRAITGLSSGQTYYFTVTAYDNDAYHLNETSDSLEVNIAFDGQAPIISSLSASTTTTGATITYTTDELGSSKVDYGLTSSYGSTTSETDTSPRVTSHSVSLSGLQACTIYHYRVRSKDAATNERVGSDNTFTTLGCDSSAPAISLTALSPDPNTNTTPALTGTTTDAEGTVTAVQFQMDGTGGSWSNCTANDGTFNSASEAFTCTVASALSDGSHTMHVRATDSNGNTTGSGSYTTDTFTIDTTAPGIPGSPTTTTPTNSTSQTWTFSAATDTTSGVASYAYRILDSLSNLITSGTNNTRTVITSLTDGIYTFFVKAVDNAGNQGSESSGSVTVDTAAPTISSVAANPADTGATLTWTTNEQSSSRVNYGLTSSYGSATSETDTSPRVTSHSVSLTGLTACTSYHYRVRSKDEATNERVGSDNTFTTTGCAGSASVDSQTQVAVTTASGGTVSLLSDSKGVALDIPAAFAGSDANFQIKQLEKSAAQTETSRPAGKTLVASYLYDLKAFSDISTKVTSFSNPITITMTYGASEIASFDETTLKIYRWDGSTWYPLSNCVTDTNARTVTCTTTAFSVFGLFGDTANPTSTPSSSGNSSSGRAYDGGTNSLRSCGDQRPGSAPDLFQIDRVGTTARVYIAPAINPYNKYYIAFGIGDVTEQFGVEFTMTDAKGVIDYTINELNPKTAYSFKVRAGNGCATGEWSNVLKVKALRTAKQSFYRVGGTSNEIDLVAPSQPSKSKKVSKPTPTPKIKNAIKKTQPAKKTSPTKPVKK